jgi:hypothetical protein
MSWYLRMWKHSSLHPVEICIIKNMYILYIILLVFRSKIDKSSTYENEAIILSEKQYLSAQFHIWCSTAAKILAKLHIIFPYLKH